MLFTQPEFLVFFLAVLIAARSIKQNTWRNVLLLVASYYFYAYWDIRFCGLLILSTIVDYCVARFLEETDDIRKRRWLLASSVIVNLGVLGFFKYFNFFIESAALIVQSMGLSAKTLNIILPVGISFYTFQTMSYSIDVYRRKLRATDDLLQFALYVSFFPQLVAGPIVRARELLPQLAAIPAWSNRRLYGGLQQMLRGAIKKVLLADRLGEMVDPVFADPAFYSSSTIWLAVIAYAGQIYYDFSGYTDMAIGGAKILGYRFPKNFKHPYLANSVSEFWHRWHITLSRWLRDYLYIPLGGNRGSTLATYRNLIITMTLGGLWHGASWTFVLWGVLHGVALCAERLIRGSQPSPKPKPFYSNWIGWGVTMMIVLIGWVLFRSPDLSSAISMLDRMFFRTSGIQWYPPLVIAAISLMVLEHLAWQSRWRPVMRLPYDRWYSPIATTVMIWGLVLYSPTGFQPFVYFQF